MSMSDFSVTIDSKEVLGNLEEMNERVKAGLTVIGETVGAKMTAYAQANAPWTDRTGNARSGLHHEVSWQGTTLDIQIKHSMDYGLWLEVANSEKFAILKKARDSQVDTFVSLIKSLNL